MGAALRDAAPAGTLPALARGARKWRRATGGGGPGGDPPSTTAPADVDDAPGGRRLLDHSATFPTANGTTNPTSDGAFRTALVAG